MKNSIAHFWISACVTLFLGLYLVVTPSWANNTTSTLPSITQPDNGWHFLFAPYLWMSGLKGDVTIKNNTKNVDVTFSDLMKYFEGGVEGHAEAGYNRWTLMLDAIYVRLSDNSSQQVSTVNLSSHVVTEMTLVDSAVFFRALGTYDKSLELLAGVRYFGMNNSLDLNVTVPMDPAVNLGTTFAQNETSLSPIVGARVKYAVTPKTKLWARGDVGGFNVDNMRNTWSASAGVTYEIHHHVEIAAAYRVLKIDYANDPDQFKMDTYLYGPAVGIVFFA